MEKLIFKQLTRNILKDRFGLIQKTSHEVLEHWLAISKRQEISDLERQVLQYLQKKLNKRCDSWNEFELSEWFIGPVVSLVDFETDDNSLFAFHEISALVNDCELTGKPDVMYARGIDSPQMPYFFFHEYKRQTDPDGNPLTQLLGAMLTAQALNGNGKPVYGIYVIGADWRFVILNANQWCESRKYIAEGDDLFLIISILKALKELILS